MREIAMSLPTRERGLKLINSSSIAGCITSLPTRERGLKRVGRENLNEDITVAPYAGAWIETVKLVKTEAVITVAPYAGAWIETGGACPRFFSSLGSLPTRERGLKHYKHLIMIGRAKSLPTRERGLKHRLFALIQPCRRSLPTRERGLKRKFPLRRMRKRRVAPYAGAWIETSTKSALFSLLPCRSLRGSVD